MKKEMEEQLENKNETIVDLHIQVVYKASKCTELSDFQLSDQRIDQCSKRDFYELQHIFPGAVAEERRGTVCSEGKNPAV